MSGFLHRDAVTPLPKPAKRGAKPRRPLPRVGRKGRKAAREMRKARKIVRARSGGRCEVLQDLWPHECSHVGEHYHHVRRAGQGGLNDPENLLHVCHVLHEEVHAHPTAAFSAGLLATRSAP